MQLESIPKKIGILASWLTTILVCLIFVDVVLRYLLDTTSVWMLDLEWHLFAAIFLLGAAYTLAEDKHVRVDVFYNNFSDKKKAWINLPKYTVHYLLRIVAILILIVACTLAY